MSDGDSLYSTKHPAKVILSCDKVLCPKSTHDVTKFKVIYTLNNTGPLTKVAPPCPKKGVIGKDQEACVDYKQSFRTRWRPLLALPLQRRRPRAPASSADERRQRRPDDAQQLRGLRPGALLHAVDLRAASPNSPRLTQLRQRHPDDAQQLQGLARLFGKPVCVGIIVLTCDPCSHSEQESALVRDVG